MGYCRICHRHNVETSHSLREVDGGLVRTEEGESIGVCLVCEVTKLLVSRRELLDTLKLWGDRCVHDQMILEGLVQSLPDGDYTSSEIKKVNTYQKPGFIRIIEALVAATTRQLEQDTPNGKYLAAHSVLRSWEELRDEAQRRGYDKWYLIT